MNLKRFFAAFIVVFIFVIFYDWLVHGVLLEGVYNQTKEIWRSEAEMKANWPLALLYELFLSFWFCFAFVSLFREGGIGKGLLFGLYFGVFAGILIASWYLWVPVSAMLGVDWFFSSLIESLIAGALVGAIYKR